MLMHGNDPSRALGRVLTLALNISSQPIHVKGETHLSQKGVFELDPQMLPVQKINGDLGMQFPQGKFLRES